MDASLVSLLKFVLVLFLAGFCIWLLFKTVPIPPIFRTLIIVAIVIFVVLWLIDMVGGSGSHSHVGYLSLQLQSCFI